MLGNLQLLQRKRPLMELKAANVNEDAVGNGGQRVEAKFMPEKLPVIRQAQQEDVCHKVNPVAKQHTYYTSVLNVHKGASVKFQRDLLDRHF